MKESRAETRRRLDMEIGHCLRGGKKMKVIVSDLAADFGLSNHTVYGYIRAYMRNNGFANREAVYVSRISDLLHICSKMNDEVSQTLGLALGYPKFCDDTKNFPDATESDGVCVGDHVCGSLADEAADRIRSLQAQLARTREGALEEKK